MAACVNPAEWINAIDRANGHGPKAHEWGVLR